MAEEGGMGGAVADHEGDEVDAGGVVIVTGIMGAIGREGRGHE